MASLSSYWDSAFVASDNYSDNCSLMNCPNFTRSYELCDRILQVGYNGRASRLVLHGLVRVHVCKFHGCISVWAFALFKQTSGADAIAGLRLVASLLRQVLDNSRISVVWWGTFLTGVH